MFILKNAFRNLLRGPGRTALIGVIVLVIAFSSCIALSIKHAAKAAEAEGLRSLSITASIGLDMEKLRSEAGSDRDALREIMRNSQSLSIEELMKYSKSENVKDFTYTIKSSVSQTDGFQPYSEETEDESATNTTQSNGPKIIGDGQQRGFQGMGVQGDFTITGYSSENAMSPFVGGTSKITSGKVFTFEKADNQCLVSDTLATLNGLKVGDKIKISNPNKESETYTLTISGIYSTSESSTDTGMRFSASSDPINQIYTNYKTMEAISAKSAKNADKVTDTAGNETTSALRTLESGIYSFADASAYENFKTDVKTLGLSDNYSVVSSNLASYESSLTPLKNLSKFADTFLMLILVIGGIILAVLNIFNIRERKYEVGVLTAIGMHKWKVAAQFITELFIITVVAIGIGTAAGSIASVPTASALLQGQLESVQSQVQTQNVNFGRPLSPPGEPGSQTSNGSTDYIEEIQASTDMNTVIQLIGIGVLLTIVSSCTAVVFILRYEPLKILANRN